MRGRSVEDEPEACDGCGGQAFRPGTLRERFWRWFVSGAGAGRMWHCRTCGASWSGGSAYVVLHAGSGSRWRRWARLPLDVVVALRAARTWQPVPVFYAVVAAIALAPAVVLTALTPLGWWAAVLGVPAVAIVVAFLWSLTGAVGRGRHDVLRHIAPERAWRREFEDELALVRAQVGAFRLLTPEGWPGALCLEPGARSVPPRGARVLDEVTVVADQGDPLLDPDRHAAGRRPATPRVEVRCSREASSLAEDVAESEFAARAFAPAAPDLDAPGLGDRRAVERRLLAASRAYEREHHRRMAELAGRWEDTRIFVDGIAVPARRLTHPDADVGVALFELDGQAVMVVAEGVDLDALRLVEVADPTPLVHELERRRRRMVEHLDA